MNVTVFMIADFIIASFSLHSDYERLLADGVGLRATPLRVPHGPYHHYQCVSPKR